MSEDFRKKKLKPGEKSLWEKMGRDTSQKETQEEPSRWGDWFKKRILGEKTAAEVATEEIEKLKKTR
jgi:hypothetical protein